MPILKTMDDHSWPGLGLSGVGLNWRGSRANIYISSWSRPPQHHHNTTPPTKKVSQTAGLTSFKNVFPPLIKSPELNNGSSGLILTDKTQRETCLCQLSPSQSSFSSPASLPPLYLCWCRAEWTHLGRNS